MEKVDDIGSIIIYKRDLSRYELLVPSIKISGQWQDSDISNESEEVQEFCKTQWTNEIKQSYQNHVDENLVE